MMRARTQSACVQSDSIKGLAQSIAKPAYHRLLNAEPVLRRAVPTLIIAFLVTICFGAFVQVTDHGRQMQASAQRDLTALADLLTERLDRNLSERQSSITTSRLQELLSTAIPAWGLAASRSILIVGADQQLIAGLSADWLDDTNRAALTA
ncbi:MAG: PAS domain-containing sensor histidine kinase, partial [Xanthobacteraceae bacterium]